MEAVIESYSGRKVFYRSRRNLWEIPMKTAICNTFSKINFFQLLNVVLFILSNIFNLATKYLSSRTGSTVKSTFKSFLTT